MEEGAGADWGLFLTSSCLFPWHKSASIEAGHTRVLLLVPMEGNLALRSRVQSMKMLPNENGSSPT